jgi:hypothetical protein
MAPLAANSVAKPDEGRQRQRPIARPQEMSVHPSPDAGEGNVSREDVAATTCLALRPTGRRQNGNLCHLEDTTRDQTFIGASPGNGCVSNLAAVNRDTLIYSDNSIHAGA